jgi:hypothetical protein
MINAGYFGSGGAGAGGFMSGNAKVYTGNTFSAVIGGGGSGGIENGNYNGTNGTAGNPSYITGTALPYQITAHGSQYGVSGGTGSGFTAYTANGSPALGIAGFNGWPGSIDPGGGGGGAGGAGVQSPNPVHPGVYLGAGGIGAGIVVHTSLGTPGPDSTLRYFAGGGGGYNSKANPNTRDSEGGAGGGGASMPTYGGGPGGTGFLANWYGPSVNGKGGYNGFAGNVNTGGGGGSGGSPGGVAQGGDGGAGGSGIVMFRYPTVAGGFTYYP